MNAILEVILAVGGDIAGGYPYWEDGGIIQEMLN